jgi:hypothetical protein
MKEMWKRKHVRKRIFHTLKEAQMAVDLFYATREEDYGRERMVPYPCTHSRFNPWLNSTPHWHIGHDKEEEKK